MHLDIHVPNILLLTGIHLDAIGDVDTLEYEQHGQFNEAVSLSYALGCSISPAYAWGESGGLNEEHWRSEYRAIPVFQLMPVLATRLLAFNMERSVPLPMPLLSRLLQRLFLRLLHRSNWPHSIQATASSRCLLRGGFSVTFINGRVEQLQVPSAAYAALAHSLQVYLLPGHRQNIHIEPSFWLEARETVLRQQVELPLSLVIPRRRDRLSERLATRLQAITRTIDWIEALSDVDSDARKGNDGQPATTTSMNYRVTKLQLFPLGQENPPRRVQQPTRLGWLDERLVHERPQPSLVKSGTWNGLPCLFTIAPADVQEEIRNWICSGSNWWPLPRPLQPNAFPRVTLLQASPRGKCDTQVANQRTYGGPRSAQHHR